MFMSLFCNKTLFLAKQIYIYFINIHTVCERSDLLSVQKRSCEEEKRTETKGNERKGKENHIYKYRYRYVDINVYIYIYIYKNLI